MKKILIFIGGIVCGVLLTFVVSLLIVKGNSSRNGITLFEQEGECISENSFRVLQVRDTGEALANELDGDLQLPTGLTVLFLNEEGQSYYDDQTITMPPGKCARQIGVFKYMSNMGMEKTVPVVGIRDK